MKNLSIPALILVAVIGLTGCSGNAIKPAPDVAEQSSAVEPTVAPPEPAAEEGSREAPLPYGQEVLVYEPSTSAVLWQITVSPVYDVTADIAAANSFNQPPQNGAYIGIPVHAVWQGVEPVQPWLDFQNGLEFVFVSTEGVTYEATYAVQPWPALTDISDLYQGGSADFVVTVDAPAGVTGLVRVVASGYEFFVGAL